MTVFREHEFWSVTLGVNAARLSVPGRLGGEHFAIVPKESGKAWREMRERVLEELEAAVERGDPPGEVMI